MQSITPVWDLAEIIIGLMRTVLLFGPPGTGKSLAAHNTDLAGRELFSLTLTPDTAAAELRGHYVPAGNEFQWRDGPAITAWRRGGRLVVNEIHKAGGDALSFLLAALDNPETARLTLPNGETVRPHKNFQVIATMNGDPDEELEPALRDRFPAALEISEPHPKGIARLPEDLQQVARNTACCAQEERRVSLRQWLAFADLRRDIGADDAARVIFNKRASDVMAALRIASS